MRQGAGEKVSTPWDTPLAWSFRASLQYSPSALWKLGQPACHSACQRAGGVCCGHAATCACSLVFDQNLVFLPLGGSYYQSRPFLRFGPTAPGLPIGQGEEGAVGESGV